MAQACKLCSKTPKKAVKLKKLRGKYNPTQKRKQKPNLQKITLPDGSKILACVKCAKTVTKKMSA